MDFSAFSAWGTFNIVFVILASMLVGNILKKTLPPLRKSLIPTSVLGGLILLVVSSVYYLCTDELIFNTAAAEFNGVLPQLFYCIKIYMQFLPDICKISFEKTS